MAGADCTGSSGTVGNGLSKSGKGSGDQGVFVQCGCVDEWTASQKLTSLFVVGLARISARLGLGFSSSFAFRLQRKGDSDAPFLRRNPSYV